MSSTTTSTPPSRFASAEASASERWIKRHLLLEIVANCCAVYPIIYPTRALGAILADATWINPASIFLTRLFGDMVLGYLVSPLIMAYTYSFLARPSAAAPEVSAKIMRRGVSAMMAFGELAVFVAVLIDAFSEVPALPAKTTIVALSCGLPPTVWRLSALWRGRRLVEADKAKHE